MKIILDKGDKVDLVGPRGERQRAIVVKPPTGKRGRGAAVTVNVTSPGPYARGPIIALRSQITERMNTKYMR